jgi:L-ribulose-5-phosphate 4-epimerase
MSKDEIESDYELNTGKVIVRRFAQIDPMQIPAVLVANHGPFTWGKDAAASVTNAVVLEEVARMAHGALTLSPIAAASAKTLLDKHYLRKHGKNAYYGQKKRETPIESSNATGAVLYQPLFYFGRMRLRNAMGLNPFSL